MCARDGESAGSDGNEGHQEPADAAEPPGNGGSGGFRAMELRAEQVVEVAPVVELQGGGERRRGAAAETRIARVREVCEAYLVSDAGWALFLFIYLFFLELKLQIG